MRLILRLSVVVLVGLSNLALWALPNRPVALEPLPGGKLASVSFAPFRDGQSPLTGVYPTRDQIAADLQVLKDQVTAIRTYTSLEGLEAAPELARQNGLKVTMGAWIGSKKASNEKEIASLIDLANRYPDVITRVIVGNEVLLRNDASYDELVSYIHRVRQAVRQPVGYADVWEYWLKFPQMADHVDFITIHLLPYWEDVPVGVDQAPGHVVWSYNQIAQRFPGKPILVGETGWPTAGRSRGPAVPGLVNKARFVNGFVRLAGEHGFDYNIIEAFDQNWKIRLEGTVGGHWGLYSADRQPKFALSGPVVEHPDWRWPCLASLILAGIAFGLVLRTWPAAGFGRQAVLALLVQGLASGLVWAGMTVADLAYYLHDVAFGWGMVGLQAAFAAALVAAMAGDRSGAGWRSGLAPWGQRLFGLLVALAIIWTGLLVFDGRYRGFPTLHYLGPVFGLALLMLQRWTVRGPGTGAVAAVTPDALFGPGVDSGAVAPVPAVAEPTISRYAGISPTGTGAREAAARASARTRWLEIAAVVALVAGAVGLIVAEGFSNREAPFWSALLAILAIPYGAAVAEHASARASGAETAPRSGP